MHNAFLGATYWKTSGYVIFNVSIKIFLPFLLIKEITYY